MKRIVLVIIFMGFYCAAFGSEDNVAVIQTQQKARVGKVNNYIVITSESSYNASVPEIIQAGTYIQISYVKSGSVVNEKFSAACIEYRDSDGLCWVRTTCQKEISDTLYVHNCKVISK